MYACIYREISSKELAHATVGIGEFRVRRAGWQVGNSGTILFAVAVLSVKSTRRLADWQAFAGTLLSVDVSVSTWQAFPSPKLESRRPKRMPRELTNCLCLDPGSLTCLAEPHALCGKNGVSRRRSMRRTQTCTQNQRTQVRNMFMGEAWEDSFTTYK